MAFFEWMKKKGEDIKENMRLKCCCLDRTIAITALYISLKKKKYEKYT